MEALALSLPDQAWKMPILLNGCENWLMTQALAVFPAKIGQENSEASLQYCCQSGHGTRSMKTRRVGASAVGVECRYKNFSGI